MANKNLHFHESWCTSLDPQHPKLGPTSHQHQFEPCEMIREIGSHSMAADRCAKNLSEVKVYYASISQETLYNGIRYDKLQLFSFQ